MASTLPRDMSWGNLFEVPLWAAISPQSLSASSDPRQQWFQALQRAGALTSATGSHRAEHVLRACGRPRSAADAVRRFHGGQLNVLAFTAFLQTEPSAHLTSQDRTIDVFLEGDDPPRIPENSMQGVPGAALLLPGDAPQGVTREHHHPLQVRL